MNPTVRPQVTITGLRRFAEQLPRDAKDTPTVRSYKLSLRLLNWYFGRDWVMDKIVNRQARSDFFRNDFESPQTTAIHTIRVISLAEMLVNLQAIEGFDSCITQMKAGQVESTFAELTVGKIVYTHEMKFKFNTPQGRLGSDYDLEFAHWNGVLACADTKCKFETTEVSVNSVVDSLKRARDQLPRDRPGIVFVSIPNAWFLKQENQKECARALKAAQDFVEKSRRVVSVKFYAEVINADERGGFSENFILTELPDNEWRIFSEKSWLHVLVDEFSGRRFRNGLPPFWLRLFGL